MGSVEIHPPKTPVTKGSNTIAAATVPNVCKMPGPPAPFVPAPLPNIAKSGSSPKDYSKKVKIEGNTVAIKGATFTSMGDVASKATGGGLVSANTHGPAKFVGPGSLTVKIEGKSVHLLAEPMLNNCGGSGSPPNSATLMGAVHKPGGPPSPDEVLLCGWCGKPLDGHESIKTDDKKMVQEAADQPAKGTGKKVGAMSVGGGPVIKSQSGGGDGKLFNLKAGKEIPLSDMQKKALQAKGNELGNCCEQQMLREHFVGKGKPPFPPPGGITSIRMGITNKIGGRPSDKEIRGAKPEKKCGTCEDALKMMLCTDDQKKD
jgi:Domain of unknown function (DUF4150)